MTTETFAAQITFIMEIDRLKHVLRRNPLLDGSRRENSAEHSWHLAMMAMLLAEHANQPVDVLHVVKILLIHDIVEIDAGDTFLYDRDGNDHEQREQRAAERIFGLLPATQRDELYTLWREYEELETAESQFARALDRLMPLLHNYHNHGGTWQEYGITHDQVYQANSIMAQGSQTIWEYAQTIIADAKKNGYFPT